MSSKSRKPKSPRLDYYPNSLNSPDYNSCGNDGNTAVIVASVILVILIIFVVISGIWYWSSSSCGMKNNQKKSVVTFAAHKKVSDPKELQECSKELLSEIMSGKTGPVILAFVAPWCGYCTQMKPNLIEAAKESKIPIYTLTQENGKEHVVAAAKHLDVKGFPMIFKIENGKAMAYQGDRSKDSIVAFAK